MRRYQPYKSPSEPSTPKTSPRLTFFQFSSSDAWVCGVGCVCVCVWTCKPCPVVRKVTLLTCALSSLSGVDVLETPWEKLTNRGHNASVWVPLVRLQEGEDRRHLQFCHEVTGKTAIQLKWNKGNELSESVIWWSILSCNGAYDFCLYFA